jgi:hypothetical protein
VAAVGQRHPSGYLVQALASAALSRRLGDRFSVFGEIFFASPAERRSRDAVGADAGAIYLITNRLALDAAVETTLIGSGPDHTVRIGLSVRFGR